MKTQANVRWMIKRDLPEVVDIETSSAEHFWCEADILKCCRAKNHIAIVAEFEGMILGYLVYELCQGHLHVLNCVVRPEYRRKGIGTQLIRKLVSKLSLNRRKAIEIEVRESNLPAQLFLRSLKFLALDILRDWYQDEVVADNCSNSFEDAFYFRYDLGD